jgi:hypothetical protein
MVLTPGGAHRWSGTTTDRVSAHPALQRRIGTAPALYAALALFAADLVVMAVGAGSVPVLVVTVIVSGAFIGVNNTLTSQAVMLVAPVERPVASAPYGFVRFLGGAPAAIDSELQGASVRPRA